MKESNPTCATTRNRKDAVISQTWRFLFAPLRPCVMLFLVLFMVPVISAQEVAETIKVRTRVVFMDALVKDKHTGTNVSELTAESFTVLDDGQPRTISYFTREGQARKPLALIMILDLRDDGAGRYLKREEVRKSIVDELAKLPEGDQVAILAINLNSVDDKTAAIRNGKAMWLTQFTRDRNQLETALARIPALIAARPESDQNDEAKRDQSNQNREGSASVTVKSDPNESKPDEGAPAKPKDEILETETIKGKNGAVITRTTKKDGSVSVKRVSGNGKVNIELDNIYDMAGGPREAAKKGGGKRKQQ